MYHINSRTRQDKMKHINYKAGQNNILEAQSILDKSRQQKSLHDKLEYDHTRIYLIFQIY